MGEKKTIWNEIKWVLVLDCIKYSTDTRYVYFLRDSLTPCQKKGIFLGEPHTKYKIIRKKKKKKEEKNVFDKLFILQNGAQK